jgi:hypothetical protein
MARMSGASAWTTFLALTVGAGCTGPGPEADAGTGGAGGAEPPATATTGAVSTGAGSGGGGGAVDSFNCDPAAEAGSIYERAAVAYGAPDPVSMCRYRGDVMLVVNTAAL